jgi:hypothetical protein
MKQSATSQNSAPMTEVHITWRQWPDGRWEAWITDGNGVPPRLVCSQAELEQFLVSSHESREPESCSSEVTIPND